MRRSVSRATSTVHLRLFEVGQKKAVKVAKAATPALPPFTCFVSVDVEKSQNGPAKTDGCNRKFNFSIDAKYFWHILACVDILSIDG
jgi:hypothetical protein